MHSVSRNGIDQLQCSLSYRSPMLILDCLISFLSKERFRCVNPPTVCLYAVYCQNSYSSPQLTKIGRCKYAFLSWIGLLPNQLLHAAVGSSLREIERKQDQKQSPALRYLVFAIQVRNIVHGLHVFTRLSEIRPFFPCSILLLGCHFAFNYHYHFSDRQKGIESYCAPRIAGFLSSLKMVSCSQQNVKSSFEIFQ